MGMLSTKKSESATPTARVTAVTVLQFHFTYSPKTGNSDDLLFFWSLFQKSYDFFGMNSKKVVYLQSKK